MMRLALLLPVCLGCAAFAGKTDYRDYRTIQLADDESARNRAMSAYLAAHPDGQWAADVRAEYEAEEALLFEDNKSTVEGLTFYLEVYPEGRFAEQARARIEALAVVARSRREDADATRDVQRERREEQLEARRTWASQAVSYWSRILLGVTRWGSPIGEVAASSPEFDRAFGAAPRPRCSPQECIKFYQLDFAIPVPGQTRVERTIRMLLRLHLREQRLVRAEMLMPNRGFSRWYELENQTFVIDEDPTARQEAIEWALGRVVPIVREIVPEAAGIDVVPEPIDPPRVRAPNQPDPGASQLPGETAAAGGSGEPAAPTELVEPPTGELVLPLALQGLRTAIPGEGATGNLRIVVFAAADEDTGDAYDGLFLELEEPEPVTPPAAARRRPARPRPAPRPTP
ncbi:MAG: hypothetical protein H6721_23580 [Sandaracinus sp.]|nr:hypothetical protein [Sandaracinus sp.]